MVSKSVRCAGEWAFHLCVASMLPGCHRSSEPPRAPHPSGPVKGPSQSDDPIGDHAEGRASSRAIRRTSIHYELQGHPTRLPFVRATVDGRPTSMLVDSGATTHVIAAWLARERGLSIERSRTEDLADHEGHVVSLSRTSAVEIALDEWGPLPERSLPVLELPAMFADRDVGGIIAPQLLAASRDTVVLDLKHASLSLEPGEVNEPDAVAGGCALGFSASAPCSGPRVRARGVGPLFAIPAAMDGHPAQLLVDTGATTTDVLIGSTPGAVLRRDTLDAGAPAFVVSGVSLSRALAKVRLEIAECKFQRDVDVIAGSPGATCARDGALGMDVLRACTLRMNAQHLVGHCDPEE